MDSSLVVLLVLVVGIVLGAVVGWLVAQTRRPVVPASQDTSLLEAQHEAQLAEQRHEAEVLLAQQRHEAETERARIEAALAAARSEVEARLAAASAEGKELRERITALQQQYRDVVDQHRREAAERQQGEHAENKVLQQLAPVADQIKNMRAKVEELEKQRSEQHGTLAQQIRASQESAAQSRAAAEALSSALKNNSERGAYGETQLESIVESAGLLKRIDYSTQESITADSGARRPDMVIKLPGRKQLAIDSKVPYSAYIDCHAAGVSESDRARLLEQHAKHVRSHVDALSKKEYWSGLQVSPEFTVAFIPNDAILNAALDVDPGLMEHAFGRGIVLATPINLWAVLKTVAFTWRQEELAENAQELVDLGRELYKRLGTLSAHVNKLGRSIATAAKDYNKFVGTLESRVLVTARRLDAVDDAELTTVQAIDGDTRSLTAAELIREEASLLADLERPELELPVEAEIVDDERDAG